ncbi:hypothetical protein D3C77_710430 [compost metagenome]
MIQGVAEQVVQHALERNPAQWKRRNRLKTQAYTLFWLVERRHHFTHQVAQVDLLHRFVPAITNKRQKLVEDGVHVFDIAHHVVGQVTVVVQHRQRQA